MNSHTDHPMRHWDRTCPACNEGATSMTDKELLELAAKAAGYLNYSDTTLGLFIERGSRRGCSGFYWNPLTNDGDALRLAVKLQLDVSCCGDSAIAAGNKQEHFGSVYVEDDPYAATRRAIVRAAAEIGKEQA